jgi:hypothetical protein
MFVRSCFGLWAWSGRRRGWWCWQLVAVVRSLLRRASSGAWSGRWRGWWYCRLAVFVTMGIPRVLQNLYLLLNKRSKQIQL